MMERCTTLSLRPHRPAARRRREPVSRGTLAVSPRPGLSDPRGCGAISGASCERTMSTLPARAPQGILGLLPLLDYRIDRDFRFSLDHRHCPRHFQWQPEYLGARSHSSRRIHAVTIIPSFALIVRRLHDVGLTGWLAPLCYVPAFGGLALLASGLIPSETGQNQWGAMPAGVRI